MRYLRWLVLFIAAVVAAQAGEGYLDQLPTGEDWIAHLNQDLLPFWTVPAALGNPAGSFPSTRCDDGSALNFKSPCTPIAGNSYLMTPAQYLVPLSRQTFGYGVAYHLTGDPKYLAWMRAGIAYIRGNAIDPAGGMYTQKDLTTGIWGPARQIRDPQQLGYGLLGMAFYYYLTRDQGVLADIVAIEDYIDRNYYNPALGTNQWLLQSSGGTRFDQKELVADLDQVNTYLALLTPILPEPYASRWKQTLARLMHSMLATFYSPHDNLFFLAANTPQDRNLAYTGVDFGHTSKALWMMRWAGLINEDQGLFQFASAAARRHIERSYVAEDGSWAGGVLAGGAVDKNKNWWVYAELDQLAGTLALADPSAGQHLPQTNRYWFQYFVDHQYGEVWNGVNYGSNTPQKDYPKSWQWKSAYHDFEHALVGYVTAQQLLQKNFTLYYAFSGDVDAATIHPYYFSAPIDSVSTTRDDSGQAYQAVTFHGGPAAAAPTLTTVSAASFLAGPVAADSIATAYPALPVKQGTTVSVKDSAGTVRDSLVFYASTNQVNFLIPAGTVAGNATVTMTGADGTPISGPLSIVKVQPGLFQLNTGTALCAANVIRVKPGGDQSVEPVYQVDGAGNVAARPIDLSATGDQIYLSLFGTGLRSAASVEVRAGSQNLNVGYFGPQGAYAGLDQVNVGPLPKSLAGAGRVTIVLSADGQTANPVELAIQ